MLSKLIAQLGSGSSSCCFGRLSPHEFLRRLSQVTLDERCFHARKTVGASENEITGYVLFDSYCEPDRLKCSKAAGGWRIWIVFVDARREGEVYEITWSAALPDKGPLRLRRLTPTGEPPDPRVRARAAISNEGDPLFVFPANPNTGLPFVVWSCLEISVARAYDADRIPLQLSVQVQQAEARGSYEQSLILGLWISPQFSRTANLNPQSSDRGLAGELKGVLLDTERIRLREHLVIRGHYRGDQEAIAREREAVELIMKSVRSRASADRNFLLWGSSGSGKSHLVEQIVKELHLSSRAWRLINLADAQWSTDRVRSALRSLHRKSSLRLLFFDEIDSAGNEEIARTVFDSLRWSRRRKAGTARPVVVMAGSEGASIDEFRHILLRRRKKWQDLINRIPDEQCMGIPSYNARDWVVAFLASGLSVAVKRRTRFRGAEKRAVFLVCMHPSYRTTHKMRIFHESVVARMQDDGTDVLRMKHILAIGDPQFINIYTDYRRAIQAFGESIVAVGER